MSITDTASMTVEKSINFGNLIRAIDVNGSKALVGLREGTIYEVDLGSESKKTLMESHSEGEVWGLACSGNHIITSADDNKVKVWDYTQRKCVSTAIVSNEDRKAQRGGASSLTDLPDSKCARAVAHDP